MPNPIIYRISIQGTDQVLANLDAVSQRFKAGDASLGELSGAQKEAQSTMRVLNNESKLGAQLWLAQHQGKRPSH